MRRKEKPIDAFILSLISAILILFNSIMLAINPSILGIQRTPTESIVILAAVASVFGVFVLVGAFQIYKNNKVRSGPLMVLVFSLMSLIIGGALAHVHFFVAFIFGCIGAINGLRWKPRKARSH